MLRSKRPELVKQEFYALLLVHAAIRHLMTDAAAQTGQAAQDLSFIHAVRVIHRRLPAVGAIPPPGRAAWLQGVLRKITLGRAVTSRGKRNPRGVRRKMSAYPIRDRGDPLHVECTPCSIVISEINSIVFSGDCTKSDGPPGISVPLLPKPQFEAVTDARRGLACHFFRLESSGENPDILVRFAALAEPDLESYTIRLPV